jgi:hypothetical protein
MGSLHFLDLVIGLVFIYFLLSLICVSLQELKATWKKERSQNLKKWILDTFNGKDATGGLGDMIWNNIQIDGLTQTGREASYIPKEVFVSAVLDEIYYGSDDSYTKKCENCDKEVKNDQRKDPYDFYTLLDAINNPAICIPKPMQRVLRQIHAESHQNLETFRMRLERWFEMAMDRNSGTYKKKAQSFTFIAAIFVTIILNVDSIKLASHFYDNPEDAKRIADQAELYIENNKMLPPSQSKDTKEAISQIKSDIKKIQELKLPIGWEDANWEVFNEKPRVVFSSLITTTTGWIITILAVSLGAPFWFETLNKLVNLRAAGKIPNGGNSPTPSNPNPKPSQPAVG